MTPEALARVIHQIWSARLKNIFGKLIDIDGPQVMPRQLVEDIREYVTKGFLELDITDMRADVEDAKRILEFINFTQSPE